MNEEEMRKMLNSEIKKEIKLHLDSALIFTYVQTLEKEIEELKEEYKNEQLAELKELNNYIRKDKIRKILNKYAKTDIDNYAEIMNFYRELKELLGE